LATIMESIYSISSESELQQHQVAMDENLGQVEEFITELTTAMEQYKYSESTPFELQHRVARPSGTQYYVHPE
jgi:hypothetical protein